MDTLEPSFQLKMFIHLYWHLGVFCVKLNVVCTSTNCSLRKILPDKYRKANKMEICCRRAKYLSIMGTNENWFDIHLQETRCTSSSYWIKIFPLMSQCNRLPQYRINFWIQCIEATSIIYNWVNVRPILLVVPFLLKLQLKVSVWNLK